MNDINASNGMADVLSIDIGPIAGSGRCKACGCKGYRPNSPKNDYCKDCGHSWHMHESAW
jgi:hypothetical protein